MLKPKIQKPVYNSGRPAEVTNIKPVKGLFGEKRIAALERAVRNRNRRIRAQVAKMTGERYTPENYAKLARSQYVPGFIRIDFSKVTTVKEYNAIIRMLEADKSKAWKNTRTEQMRETLAKTIRRALSIDADDDPEMFAKIMTMSDSEIVSFRMSNKALISDIFEYYKGQDLDADDREWMWNRIREALGLKGYKSSDTFAV